MTLPDAYSDEGDEFAQVSKRSRGVAIGLCMLGFLGLHRFYLEKPKTAVAMLLTLGGLGVWWLYDFVLLVAGELRDGQDLPVRNWGVEPIDGAGEGRAATRAERRLGELEEQFDSLRQQFSELAERVDFAERMLAQNRSVESGIGRASPRLQAPGS